MQVFFSNVIFYKIEKKENNVLCFHFGGDDKRSNCNDNTLIIK